MRSIREFNTKIASLKSTGKITNSMKMISSVKLQRFVKQRTSATLFWQSIDAALVTLAAQPSVVADLMLAGYESPKESLIVLITGNRGMCGQYNNNAIREAVKLQERLIRKGRRITFSFVGAKGAVFFRRRDVELDTFYEGLGDNAQFDLIGNVAAELLDKYVQGTYHEIWCVYTQRQSSLSEQPFAAMLLPLQVPESTSDLLNAEFLLEPSAEKILAEKRQLILTTTLHRFITESAVSEHSARMSAMDAASANCEHMIEQYSQLRNRARQTAITTELSEIVTGKEALAAQ